MAKTGVSERVRQCVLQKYVAPARSRGERTVEVVSGDVHRELGLKNLVPQVCEAMRSKLLERHGITLTRGQRVLVRTDPEDAKIDDIKIVGGAAHQQCEQILHLSETG